MREKMYAYFLHNLNVLTRAFKEVYVLVAVYSVFSKTVVACGLFTLTCKSAES